MIYFHNYQECFINEWPDHPIEGNKLVIYKVESQRKIYHLNILAYGYLSAARIIVEKLIATNSIGAGDDNLVFPILNLCINSLEFSLKNLIYKLVEHSMCNTCSDIILENTKYTKALKSHDLSFLTEVANTMLPTSKRSIHYFEQFQKLSRFIIDIDKAGISAETTRYQFSIKGIKHEIHSDQIMVDISKFLHNIQIIYFEISSYIQSQKFGMCEYGDFTEERLNELFEAKKMMEKYENKFLGLISQLNSINNKYPYEGSINNKLLKNMHLSHSCKEDFYESFLKHLNDDELVILALGFSYNAGPAYAESLNVFKQYNKPMLLQFIYEKLSKFIDAKNHLTNFIKEIKLILNESNI